LAIKIKALAIKIKALVIKIAALTIKITLVIKTAALTIKITATIKTAALSIMAIVSGVLIIVFKIDDPITKLYQSCLVHSKSVSNILQTSTSKQNSIDFRS